MCRSLVNRLSHGRRKAQTLVESSVEFRQEHDRDVVAFDNPQYDVIPALTRGPDWYVIMCLVMLMSCDDDG